ncbi:MAG: preprotein translocase subunit SecE [Anaerosomatales bacterium]|nr:preprotein translocase subunit SecE [Coriobacteriia bacterium]MDF1543292.1 preprotein translocase subunit SecE [Anaerosomatales bacterium]MDT8434899.1 preprotein translocase subunit SecE [Anaerosomatales bacterium]
MAKATAAPKPNIIMRFVGYLGDVRKELKRVVWPSRTEVINSSLVVIVTLAFFVLFTFVIDSISVYVITLIGRIGG